ncbi:hypothetical protein [Bacillus sp. NPDC094106]|uniref:hypothetical protein n=1 Tax=Bacillus sp. NPDC094106 TaxID=3363949 RepID=UPI0037F9EDA4
MIFEATKNDIRKAFQLIVEMLSGKESSDDEFGSFTMIAKDEKVVFIGECEDFPIMTFVNQAKVIIEGTVTVSIDEIMNKFKSSFKKNVLLAIESTGQALKIDDGLSKPQEISIIYNQDKKPFDISDSKLFLISKEVFHNSICECSVAVKNTHLKGTSYLKVNVGEKVEFYATSLHQIIKKSVEAEIWNKASFFIEKDVIPRMNRLFKKDKSENIKCFLDKKELYVVTDEMKFKVSIEESVPFPGVEKVMNSIIHKDVFEVNRVDTLSRIKVIDSYYKEKEIKDTKDTIILVTLNEPFEVIHPALEEGLEEGYDEGLIESEAETVEQPLLKIQLREEDVATLLPGNIGIFRSEEIISFSCGTSMKYGLLKSVIKGITKDELVIYNADSIGCVKEPLVIEYKQEQNGHYQSLIMPVVKG